MFYIKNYIFKRLILIFTNTFQIGITYFLYINVFQIVVNVHRCRIFAIVYVLFSHFFKYRYFTSLFKYAKEYIFNISYSEIFIYIFPICSIKTNFVDLGHIQNNGDSTSIFNVTLIFEFFAFISLFVFYIHYIVI